MVTFFHSYDHVIFIPAVLDQSLQCFFINIDLVNKIEIFCIKFFRWALVNDLPVFHHCNMCYSTRNIKWRSSNDNPYFR